MPIFVIGAVALHIFERPAHDRRQFIDKRRLEGHQTILGHADQRCADGLMSAALRRQADARGRGHQHEAGILVTGVVESVQTALNERIVDRPDGNQAFAQQGVGQAHGGKRDKQIVFGDA